MPRLKQDTLLACKYLKKSLEPYGYEPIKGTICFQKHKKPPTVFCLCINDFRDKFQSKLDTSHLYNAVESNFRYVISKEGKIILV